MSPFAIYVRVSEVGDREGPSFGSPEEQEAAARAWAELEGVEVEAPIIELDVSGATAIADRQLGRLLERCEAGELEGVIVRYEDRFARDVIEGATALRRLEECGARLIATASGFDSKHLTPDKRAWFTMQMAFGQAQREKNREARLRGAQRAADRGVYLAPSAPTGYVMDDDRRISPGPTAPLVQGLFERRAHGESLRSLAAWLRSEGIEITKSGIRVLLRNRAYVGEATVPTARKGEVEVRKNAHEPLVTEEQWERAQAARGTYHPRNGKWSGQARLTGIATCSGCTKPLSVHGGGKRKDVAYYACTSEGCPQRVGIRMERLDDWTGALLTDCFLAGVPEVRAVMEGSDRYERALEGVTEARAELEVFIEEVRVSDLGKEAWMRGKQSRTDALAVARKALAAIPAPRSIPRAEARKLMTWKEAQPALDREHNRRFLSKIIVHPVGRGRRVPVAERVTVYLVGGEEPLDLETVTPVGDPEVLKMLEQTA